MVTESSDMNEAKLIAEVTVLTEMVRVLSDKVNELEAKQEQGVPVGVGGYLTTTTPQQRTWVGLTDDEIEQGIKESWVTEQAFQSAVWWAEAKLKEKNT